MVDDAHSQMETQSQGTTGKAKQRAQETAQKVEDTAEQVAQQAETKAKQLGDQVQQQTRELTMQVQEQAKTTLEERKSMMASELEALARAFRQTGDHLREQNHQEVAKYSTFLADRVERVSGYLQQQNVDTMMHDAEDMARRQPELFMGTAFGLGLLAARFLKSSSEHRSQQARMQQPYTQSALMEAPEQLPETMPGQRDGGTEPSL